MKNVVHCKKEAYDVYIGRPSPWGNPFSHLEKSAAEFKVSNRDEAVSKYRKWLYEQPELLIKANQELKGKILGCWCSPLACHGDVLHQVSEATILYRPVGMNEFKLIEDSGFTAFPPRLPEQPIFYPVCNLDYAKQISNGWNKDGHVVRFLINNEYIKHYQKQIVGSRIHEEYWIPAEDLETFNQNIIGKIHIVASHNSTSNV